jgi:hypothetical protein
VELRVTALLLLYCCFTAALLLLVEQRVTALLLLYCCFTAALLTEYRFVLRAGVQRDTVSRMLTYADVC